MWTSDPWERATMSRFMRTCRTIYQRGVPYLLRCGEVQVDQHRLISFLLFLNADPSRCKYVWDVTLSFYDFIHPNAAKLFNKLLPRMTSLKVLNISSSGPLDLDPQIPTILASLPHIEDLTLSHWSNEAARMIQAMKAPVRKASITYWTDDPQDFVYHLSPPPKYTRATRRLLCDVVGSRARCTVPKTSFAGY